MSRFIESKIEKPKAFIKLKIDKSEDLNDTDLPIELIDRILDNYLRRTEVSSYFYRRYYDHDNNIMRINEIIDHNYINSIKSNESKKSKKINRLRVEKSICSIIKTRPLQQSKKIITYTTIMGIKISDHLLQSLYQSLINEIDKIQLLLQRRIVPTSMIISPKNKKILHWITQKKRSLLSTDGVEEIGIDSILSETTSDDVIIFFRRKFDERRFG